MSNILYYAKPIVIRYEIQILPMQILDQQQSLSF